MWGAGEFEIVEGQGPHLRGVRVGLLIALEDRPESLADGGADEGGVGGIFVALHEGGDVRGVPCRDLGDEGGANGGFVGHLRWGRRCLSAADCNLVSYLRGDRRCLSGEGVIANNQQNQRERRDTHDVTSQAQRNLRSAYNECMSAALAESPFRVVHTVCSHDCPDSCAVLVTVDAAGRAIKVQGDPTQPVTNGFLCGKVAKYLDRVYAPDRILYPLKRKSGVAKGPLTRGAEHEAFERVSWDEALEAHCGAAEGDGGAVWAGVDSALQLCGHDRGAGIRFDGPAVLSSAGRESA